MSKLKGWRTIIFNGIVVALGSIQAADLATVVPEAYVPAALAVVSAINLWLRAITDTPVGKKA